MSTYVRKKQFRPVVVDELVKVVARNKRLFVRRSAIRAVVAMSQGDTPTLRELLAAWEDGLIDTTPFGEQVIKKELYHK